MRSDVLTALAADVDALTSLCLTSTPIAELQALGAAIAPLAHRLDAVLSTVVGELDVRGSGTVPDGDGAVLPTAAWLRDAASVSARTAGRDVRTAVGLRELPQVTEAILDGTLTVEHGRVLVRLVGKVPAQTLLDSEPAILEVARRTDPDQRSRSTSGTCSRPGASRSWSRTRPRRRSAGSCR